MKSSNCVKARIEIKEEPVPVSGSRVTAGGPGKEVQSMGRAGYGDLSINGTKFGEDATSEKGGN